MIVAPAALAASRGRAAVRAGWDEAATGIRHAPVGTAAFHWVVDGPDGPRWFVSADASPGPGTRRRLVSGYEVAAGLADHTDYVLVPQPDRSGRVTVEPAPGYLLTVVPFAAGEAGSGPLGTDAERAAVAELLGDLHSLRPLGAPAWRPAFGWRGEDARAGLHQVLDGPWEGGPLAELACRLVRQSRAPVTAALARFDLVAGAVQGAPDPWVLTHGRPGGGHLLRTADGLRLVGWRTLAIAPRERDLHDVVGRAQGEQPLAAYGAAAGRHYRLSPDTLEMFALEAHLTEVASHALRLCRRHTGDEDDVRALADLEAELAALAERRLT
ncbi:MAG: hypothetical protein ACXVW8_12040 [Nocardioidaceae bacterium]